MELVAISKSVTGETGLYKDGDKFYTFSLSIFDVSGKPVKEECSVETAKLLFSDMNQRYSYKYVFEE